MKIALIQTEIKDFDIRLNIQYIGVLLSKIEADTDLVVLPEMFLTGFVSDISLAKESKEKGLNLMRGFAQRTGIAIDGSLLIEENGKYYNRHYFITESSECFYDKIHLFSLSLEAQLFNRGKEINVIAEYKDYKIKLLTCYDLRFPSCSQNAYKNNNFLYDILLYVASWPSCRKEQWTTLLKSRAIENQAFVIATNRQGFDEGNIFYSGDSCVINPKGELLSEETNYENIIHYYNIDKQELNDCREKFPVFIDWKY